MKPVDYALIWREEQEILWEIAARVPGEGTIVEIGTALGGTARLMHEATLGRGVRIFTVDMAPLQAASDNLRETGVTQIVASSAAAAADWAEQYRLPIDLLYIDGNHSFDGVYQDLSLWAPHLRPGATLVFHDYDPPERGGVAHFGVRVCLDTLVRLNLLDSPQRSYKLLSGTLAAPGPVPLPVAECLATVRQIAAELLSCRERMFAQGIRDGLELLKEGHQGCDSLSACYCLDYALARDFEAALLSSRAPGEFRRWAEALAMLDHGYGASPFPAGMATLAPVAESAELSRFLAREQVRIGLLAMILRTVVAWNV